MEYHDPINLEPYVKDLKTVFMRHACYACHAYNAHANQVKLAIHGLATRHVGGNKPARLWEILENRSRLGLVDWSKER
jgi:cytochrome c2